MFSVHKLRNTFIHHIHPGFKGTSRKVIKILGNKKGKPQRTLVLFVLEKNPNL